MIAAKGIDLERLATHTFALEQAETAFRMFDNRETEKAVFIRKEPHNDRCENHRPQQDGYAMTLLVVESPR